MLKRIPFTQQGYDALLAKLTKLREERPEAVKELARARELGDLSENGLYKAARARLSSLDGQINRAEFEIKLAEVIKKQKSDIVVIGSKVTVDDGHKLHAFEIVGDLEAFPKENKISQNSPIGNVLMGKGLNDVVEIKTPAGVKHYKIIKIS